MKNNYLTYAGPLSGSYAGSDCLQRRRCAGKTRTFADCRSRIAGISRIERGIGIVRLEKRDFEKTCKSPSGAGEYRVNVLDPSIASATVEGNLLTVPGLVVGKTEVVVSDKGGSYESLKINVYNSERRYARHRTYRFDVEDGRTGHHDVSESRTANPAYRVSSSAPEIATAEIGEDGATVTVTGLSGERADDYRQRIPAI